MDIYYNIKTSKEFTDYLKDKTTNFTMVQVKKIDNETIVNIPPNYLTRCEVIQRVDYMKGKTKSDFITFKKIGDMKKRRRLHHTVYKLIDSVLMDYYLFIPLKLKDATKITTLENYYNNTYEHKFHNGNYILKKTESISLLENKRINKDNFITSFENYFLKTESYKYIANNIDIIQSNNSRYDDVIRTVYSFFYIEGELHYKGDITTHIDKMFKHIINSISIVKTLIKLMPDYKVKLYFMPGLTYTIRFDNIIPNRLYTYYDFNIIKFIDSSSGFKVLDNKPINTIYDICENFINEYNNIPNIGRTNFPIKYVSSITRTLKIKNLLEKSKKIKKEKASTM